jgi:hypothetical protein
MSYNLEQHSGLNAVFAVATPGANLTGLTGGVTTHSTSLFGFVIDGVCFNKAVATGAATPTVDAATGLQITLRANQARAIVWAVNAAGTTVVLAGPVVENSAGSVCPYPAVPAGHAVIAVHTIAGGPTLSGTWTFGVNNWNVAGITVGTVRNVAGSIPGFALSV